MGLGIIWQWMKRGYWDRAYGVDENGILCFYPKDQQTPAVNDSKDPFADRGYLLYDVKLSPFRDLGSKKLMVGIKVEAFELERAVPQAMNGPRLAPVMSWLDASASVHFNTHLQYGEKLAVRLRDKETGYLFETDDPEARIYKKKSYQVYVAPADQTTRLRGVFPVWA